MPMSDPNRPVVNLGDAKLVHRIDSLVEEEHRLERRHAGDGLDEQEQHRLREIEVQLDQAWDLLRQRRARRHAGQNPDEAELRSPEVVEHYQQ